MSNTIFITANWTTGALSQQTISRQYDNNRYAVQFIGYPEGDGTEELDLYLLVWMSTAPGQKPGEITPIQLNSDQWYISNYFTQQVQVIKFQLCVLNEAGTYEAHSPIFSGRIGDSLEHDGTSHDIDVSTLFDAYREYVEELIIGAGAVIIDPVPTQGSANAVSSGGVYKEIDSFTETTRNINIVEMGRYNNTQAGNIYEQSSNNYYGMSAFVAVEPNTNYVISCGGIVSESSIKTTVLLVDANGNVLSRSGYNNANARAITTPAAANRIHVFYNSNNTITIGDDAYCQIEKGTSATPHINPVSAIDAISREIIAYIEASVTEKLGYKLQIAEGIDFDDIMDIGIYTSIYARIPTYINYPSLFSGVIIVYSTNTIIVQMLIDSNNDIYTRYYNSYVWSGWIKHARNSDIEQLATRINTVESIFDSAMADEGDIWGV